jgi:5-methylcytosine-specific restriction endonuclease McrA
MDKSKKWAQQENDYFNENYGKILVKEIAKKLGRSMKNIYDKGYKIKNKEKIREYKRQYYQKKQKYYFKRPEVKARKKEYEKNPKRVEYRKRYRKEKGTEYAIKYYNTIQGHTLRILNSSKRRVREKNIKEAFTKEEWINKLNLTNGYCPKCNKFVGINKLTLDHSPPISKVPCFFVYTIKNIEPLCNECNASKNNKI